LAASLDTVANQRLEVQALVSNIGAEQSRSTVMHNYREAKIFLKASMNKSWPDR